MDNNIDYFILWLISYIGFIYGIPIIIAFLCNLVLKSFLKSKAMLRNNGLWIFFTLFLWVNLYLIRGVIGEGFDQYNQKIKYGVLISLSIPLIFLSVINILLEKFPYHTKNLKIIQMTVLLIVIIGFCYPLFHFCSVALIELARSSLY